MLNVISHGAPGALPPLLIVHGLFGSGRNWGVIAKRLSADRLVLAPDLRNHGTSPWFDSHSYADLAEDLAEVITQHGASADVVGHSMGGKAAMALALTRPELVNSLMIADIAPVAYGHDQSGNIKVMQSVDPSLVQRRSDLVAQLSERLDDPGLVAFFAQSFDVKAQNWRLNLEVLARDMDQILGFPALEGSYTGPTAFLSGAQSDYVLPEHRSLIRPLFPNARYAKLPGAGHWLHADKPREFEASVKAFLNMVHS